MTEQWHVKEATKGWSFVFDDDGRLVATAYWGFENLIAAAPEMEEALDWILHVASGIGKSGGPPSDDEFGAALDAGKAAIAKARGYEQEGE